MKSTTIILVLLFLSSSIYSQEKFPLVTIAPALIKNAHSVVRKDFYEVEVKDSERFITRIHYVVTLLNDDSDEQLFPIGYNSHKKILTFDANLYDAQGDLIKAYTKKDATDESAISGYSIYEDSRVLYHDLSHSSYPYTVEFIAEFRTEGFLDLPDFSFYNIKKSIEKSENTIIIPEGITLQYKNLNGAPEPTKTSENGINKYTWTIQDLPAIKPEPYAPSSSEIVQRISIVPSEFTYDEWSGKMESWKSFGAFFSQLQEGRDEASPELKKIVASITKDLDTNEEKIAALYNYLQKNTRYVSIQLGIGGWQPFDANYVEKNEYGDCKALSNYMKSLLKAAGIKSHTAVIYNSRNGFKKLDPNFPELFGNHMILYVPEEKIWLECTSNDNPPDYIGLGNSNRQALLIKEDGGELIQTPNYQIGNNDILRTIDITLKEDGSAKFVGQMKLQGTAQEYFRYLKFNLSQEEQEIKFMEYFDVANISIEHLQIDASKSEPIVDINFELTAGKFARKLGKRFILTLHLFDDLPNIPAEIETRNFSVEQKRTYSSQDKISLTLPKAFDASNFEATRQNIDTAFGKYEQIMSLEVDKIVLKRNFTLNRYSGAKESYTELRQFIVDINELDQNKLMLTKIVRP